jgi:hypothetical protein
MSPQRHRHRRRRLESGGKASCSTHERRHRRAEQQPGYRLDKLGRVSGKPLRHAFEPGDVDLVGAEGCVGELLDPLERGRPAVPRGCAR